MTKRDAAVYIVKHAGACPPDTPCIYCPVFRKCGNRASVGKLAAIEYLKDNHLVWSYRFEIGGVLLFIAFAALCVWIGG